MTQKNWLNSVMAAFRPQREPADGVEALRTVFTRATIADVAREAGVTKALKIIHRELDLSMAFCGRTQISAVDKSILLPGTFPLPTAA